ncbi:MAG: DUF4157 domain-containing protein [Cellvibrio sp.]
MNKFSLSPLTHAGNFSPVNQGMLQRKCACGNQAVSGGTCESCAKKNSLQRQMRVGSSNDPLELEADRVADRVMVNQSAPAVSSFSFGQIQRQDKADDKPKEKTNEEKYEDAAKKVGEALLKTPVGKEILDNVKDIALGNWTGRIITGATATATIAALAASEEKLPMQLPEIPLDFITPGFSVKLTYNGPVNQPTDASLTFTFREQVRASSSTSKPMTESEKYRAETARIAAEQAKLRENIPGTIEHYQKNARQEGMDKINQRYLGGFDLEALKKQYPWLATPAEKKGFQLNKPTFGYQPPPLTFGDQFKLNLPGEKKKTEETNLQKKLSVGASNDPLEHEADRVADQVLANPSGAAPISSTISSVQRHSTNTAEQAQDAPASVDQTLSGSGAPLDKTVRSDMESRFGHDFSQVRIHQGNSAEKSAQDVNANAYTLGNNIVFGAGQYNPQSHTGKRLLAHELTHVIQQSNVVRPYRAKDTFNFGKMDNPPLVEDSFLMKTDKEKKPWIKNIDVSFSNTKTDAAGNNFWEGTANAHYYDNPAKFADFSFNIAGGSSELGKTDRGNFVVYRLEGVGYNSGKFSGNVNKANREGPLNRYSKDLSANMHFAVFYNGGEALHAGPLDVSSHGCVHVDVVPSRQLNYHSVIGYTKVSVTYP